MLTAPFLSAFLFNVYSVYSYKRLPCRFLFCFFKKSLIHTGAIACISCTIIVVTIIVDFFIARAFTYNVSSLLPSLIINAMYTTQSLFYISVVLHIIFFYIFIFSTIYTFCLTTFDFIYLKIFIYTVLTFLRR